MQIALNVSLRTGCEGDRSESQRDGADVRMEGFGAFAVEYLGMPIEAMTLFLKLRDESPMRYQSDQRSSV